MASIHRVASRVFGMGAGLCLAAVFAIVFLNSLRRYTLGKSLEWGEELPIYLTVYGVMFGIGVAYLGDRHICFAILSDLVPARFRWRLLAAVDLITLAMGSVLAWSGVLFAMRRGGLEASGLVGTAKSWAEVTGAEWLAALGQMATWQASIAFGGVVLAIAAAIRFVSRLRGR